MKSLFSLLLGMIFLSGCVSSLESTTRHYVIKTQTPLPPKPAGSLVPFLGKDQTRRSYKVIGEMKFRSGSSHDFILDAVQYNARIHGADAVILTEWIQEENQVVSWYPGNFHYQHAYLCDTGFLWSPFYVFPSHYTDTDVSHQIHAEMIVFLDHDTFGFLGFILEDVRNSTFLEVGQVLPGSPAAEAGILKGDHLLRVDTYLCDQGLTNYYESSPIPEIGKEMEIEIDRKGEKITHLLIPKKISS